MGGKVSVIIPVYNCEKFIEKCLKSVLAQTWPDMEIIVIDDGSEDRSLEIIHRILYGKTNVKIIHQENRGVSAARNHGLRSATGEYLTFLDSDDYLGAGYVERMVIAAQQRSAELVICGYQKVTTDGELIEKVVPGRYVSCEHEEWAYRISASCSRLYLRSVWEKTGIMFEEGVRGEDVPVSFIFNRICKNIVIIPEAEYYYVQHKKSAMHNFRGLHNMRLPYRSIEETLNKAEQFPEGNSCEFLELGIMRLLTQFIFDLGRGAKEGQLRELCDFAEATMEKHFPDFWRNKKSSIWSDLDIPFINKLQVKIFMVLLKWHMLYPAARMLGMI